MSAHNKRNRDRSQLTARTAAAVLTILLDGEIKRAELIERTNTSNGTMGRAVALLRKLGFDVITSDVRGCAYRLADPDDVRARLRVGLRLSLGDLVDAGALGPAECVGILITSGAVA